MSFFHIDVRNVRKGTFPLWKTANPPAAAGGIREKNILRPEWVTAVMAAAAS